MFQWLNGTGCIQFLLKLLRKNSEIFQCLTKFLVDSVDSLAPREGKGRQSLETDRAISRRQQTINNPFTIQDLSWSLESISLIFLGDQIQIYVKTSSYFISSGIIASRYLLQIHSLPIIKVVDNSPPPFSPSSPLSPVYWDHWQCGNGPPVSFQPAITRN